VESVWREGLCELIGVGRASSHGFAQLWRQHAQSTSQPEDSPWECSTKCLLGFALFTQKHFRGEPWYQRYGAPFGLAFGGASKLESGSEGELAACSAGEPASSSVVEHAASSVEAISASWMASITGELENCDARDGSWGTWSLQPTPADDTSTLDAAQPNAAGLLKPAPLASEQEQKPGGGMIKPTMLASERRRMEEQQQVMMLRQAQEAAEAETAAVEAEVLHQQMEAVAKVQLEHFVAASQADAERRAVLQQIELQQQALHLAEDSAKQAAASLGSYVGTLARFDLDRGFGFLECEESKVKFGRDIFLLKSRKGDCEIGDYVSFEVETGDRGRPQARNVQTLQELSRHKRVLLTYRQLYTGALITQSPPTRPTGAEETVATALAMQNTVRQFTGVIAKFDPHNGYGFLECGETFEMYGRNVFLHKTQWVEGLAIGDVVLFYVELSDKGMPQARTLIKHEELSAQRRRSGPRGLPLQAQAQSPQPKTHAASLQASPEARAASMQALPALLHVVPVSGPGGFGGPEGAVELLMQGGWATQG